jgi:CheY-like chemotaxis protein
LSQPQFFVKDQGIGIPQNRLEAVFERFVQSDIGNTRAYEGSGLGLAISKAYVELLGGKIWVESEEGKGSTFYFTLPYNAENDEITNFPQGDPSEVIQIQVNNLKVLVVEDDETSERLISINVHKFSDVILKARTGYESVEICRDNPDLDLILMDIQIPDMNGYEATRQIRQFNKEVVIIAQTALAMSGDRERAIESGCNDYISKPINKTELIALIQKYFK